MSDWTVECKGRIHKLCCTIYHKKKITMAQAQNILEDYADADGLLAFMVDEKTLMVSNNEYEYTHDGLVRFYSQLLEIAIERGELRRNNVDDLELIEFVMKETAKVLE